MDDNRQSRLGNLPLAKERSAVLFVLLLAVLLFAGAAAGELRCDACGNVITGPYRIYQGQNLHESCYFKHYALRCAYCNREIVGRYTSFEGKDLHDECYLKRFARYCGICERPISGPATG